MLSRTKRRWQALWAPTEQACPNPCLVPGRTLALKTSLRVETSFIHTPPYVENHSAQKKEGKDTIKILNQFFLMQQKSWHLTSLTPPPMLKNDNSSWSHIPNDNSVTSEKDPLFKYWFDIGLNLRHEQNFQIKLSQSDLYQDMGETPLKRRTCHSSSEDSPEL